MSNFASRPLMGADRAKVRTGVEDRVKSGAPIGANDAPSCQWLTPDDSDVPKLESPWNLGDD